MRLALVYLAVISAGLVSLVSSGIGYQRGFYEGRCAATCASKDAAFVEHVRKSADMVNEVEDIDKCVCGNNLVVTPYIYHAK